MNWQEAKELFANLFSLNVRRKKHYLAIVQLLEDMEVEDFEVIEKERVLDYFIREGGYMRFTKVMLQEQSLISKTVESCNASFL